MIGKFLGREGYPAVGISFGLDRIYDALLENGKEKEKTVTKVYIVPLGTFEDSLKIAEELRSEGVKVDIDLASRGPSKNLKYANALGIPYVLFMGEEELKQGKVKLKDMKTGKEKMLSAPELVVFLQENSQFYEIIKGTFYIKILESLRDAKDVSELVSLFPETKLEEMQKAMSLLESLKTVSKVDSGARIVFKIAPEGERLLEAYSKAKKFFST